MEAVYALKEYYILYLKKIRQVSDTTIKHYLNVLNNVSHRLKSKGLLKNHIFEIMDADQINRFREILDSDPAFIALNERGHRMYSAGLNNYYKFAEGMGFSSIKNQISVLDIPVQTIKSHLVETSQWTRSSILRKQTIELANYQCEINVSHQSFIAESTHKPYMEGHHAIPLKYQNYFDKSLDIYVNIVCLCPICHRRIHYGLTSDRIQMMNQIYELRAERLHNSGISVSKTEFSQTAL